MRVISKGLQTGSMSRGQSGVFPKLSFATNRAAICRIWTILWGSRAGPWGHILAKSGPPGGPKTGRGKNGNPGNSKFPEMGDTRHNVVSGGGGGSTDAQWSLWIRSLSRRGGARDPREYTAASQDASNGRPTNLTVTQSLTLLGRCPPPFLLLLFLSFFCGLFLYFL